VEDSPADVELVRYAFEQHGVQGLITVFTDGEAAIRKIDEIDAKKDNCDSKCEPRLAVLDVNLPRRTGLEVLQRLRLSSALCKVPVVVFTSSESERDRAMSDNLGAQEYILKGLDLDDFSKVGEVVNRLLQAGSARMAGESGGSVAK
jgi:DNA-binding response OmpR family regulator